MSTQKINTRNIVLIVMILFAVAMRLVNTQFLFLSNFTPVGAMALFGGAYFNDKRTAFVVPVLALFASDILINSIYHINPFAISYWMYLCFIIMVFIGTLIKNVNLGSVLVGSLASVAIHWLIMDMPFLYGNQYTHNLSGYALSLSRAVPFELNMLIGDLAYGAILFGGFELAKTKFVGLRSKSELAL